MMMECAECGASFAPKDPRSRYCSPSCRVHRNNRVAHERHGDTHRAAMKAYYAAHREERREKGQKWFEANREQSNAARRRNHAENRERDNTRANARHSENRDEANTNRRQWSLDHPEQARASAEAWRLAKRNSDPLFFLERSRRESLSDRAIQPWAKLLRSAKGRAIKKGVPFSLTPEWAASKWTGKCELTGVPFDMSLIGKPGGRSYSPSIDRIVPEVGYVPSNCRFILYGINRFKGEMTDDEMRIMAKLLLTTPPSS